MRYTTSYIHVVVWQENLVSPYRKRVIQIAVVHLGTGHLSIPVHELRAVDYRQP